MKAEDGIRFLRQFQELLAEGGLVATYKKALSQAFAFTMILGGIG